jgi:cytochrome c oxidase subunit 1
MYILGAFGVPRRHWDITFSGGPFTFTFNPVTDFFWALFGLGGILAVIGALIWILQVVVSVFFGKPFNGPQDLQIPIAEPPPPAKEEEGKFVAPGTFALVMLFIVAFIIFVALNYGWLSAMWEVK